MSGLVISFFGTSFAKSMTFSPKTAVRSSRYKACHYQRSSVFRVRHSCLLIRHSWPLALQILDQPLNDFTNSHSFRLSAIIDEDTVPQDRQRQGADVIKGDVGAALDEGSGLRAEDEVLAGTCSCSPADPFVDEVGGARAVRARRCSEFDGVAGDVFGDGDFLYDLLECLELLAGEEPMDRLFFATGGAGDDGDFFVLAEVVDDDVQHEAVELSLWQRVGAFHLDGVLCGEHEEGLGEMHGVSGDGDLMLLHRFEQRGLGLRRRAVDLIREDHVSKDGAFVEDHAAALLSIFEDLRAGDVGGHEIGRELDAIKAEIEDISYSFHQQRLCQTGCAGDEAMPARDEGDEHLIHDLMLADDDLTDLGEEPLANSGHHFDDLLI